MGTCWTSWYRIWTADEFVVQDQHNFGDAWRYELVDGQILAYAAPDPEHGAILAGLVGALGNRRAKMPHGCRPETGSAAMPRSA
jgi:Uma2 family endonuclease